MPFQPSPGKDDGYDISDYYGVDPRYGTLGDFVEFTHGCKQRGIRVIIDLVVNHTSDQHAWFKAARSATDSPHRDWYVWADKRPASAGKGMVFPGVQKSTWTHDKEAGAWYFHRFYDFQPDLNTSHPLVQAEILKIMGFWIQLGVSGFRMDAVPFVIAHQGRRGDEAASSSTTCCARSANSCNGARATPSCSPKPTCCRRPTWNISATTATACT